MIRYLWQRVLAASKWSSCFEIQISFQSNEPLNGMNKRFSIEWYNGCHNSSFNRFFKKYQRFFHYNLLYPCSKRLELENIFRPKVPSSNFWQLILAVGFFFFFFLNVNKFEFSPPTYYLQLLEYTVVTSKTSSTLCRLFAIVKPRNHSFRCH